MLCKGHTLRRTSVLSRSLVPRPFPPPVFDRLQYAKMEGEGLGERATCVTSGRREGRRERGSAQRRISRCFLYVISCLRTWDHNVRKTVSIQLVAWLTQGWSTQSLWVTTIGHRPPSRLPSRLPSCLPDVTHVTLSPSPSPSIFAYCKRSKTGGENGLGTRLLTDCIPTGNLIPRPLFLHSMWPGYEATDRLHTNC